MFLSIGSIILDDIHLPSGAVRTEVLGGGCVHSGMAMRLWNDEVGLLAKYGRDLPTQIECDLRTLFISDGIVQTRYAQTPHFHQFYRSDGTRYETFASPHEEMLAMVPVPSDLPESWQDIRGVHLHCRKEHVAEWIDKLKSSGAERVLWEPIDHFDHADNRDLFLKYARMADVVSPNLAEIRTLTGKHEVEEIVGFCYDEGIKTLLLRMGSSGVLVMDEQGRWLVTAPYPEKEIVDATGAGNACCGGFLAGLAETNDPQLAAKYANVSSSLALRQFGAVYPLEPAQKEARRRLETMNKKDGKIPSQSVKSDCLE